MPEQVIKPGILLGSLEPDRLAPNSGFVILFYAFQSNTGESCVLIHGTKRGDSRFKGHKIVLPIEEFRELWGQLVDFEAFSYVIRKRDDKVEIVKTDRSTLRYGRGDLSIINESVKRDVIRVYLGDKKLIYLKVNKIIDEVDAVLDYLPRLTLVDTNIMN